MGIQWTDDLATGIDLIDRQHQELFRRLNLFLDACDAGKGNRELIAILQFLDDYLHVHFATEERLQKEAGFLQLEIHRAYHQSFVKEFTALKKRFLLEGASESLVADINRFVVGWLLDHISQKDCMFNG